MPQIQRAVSERRELREALHADRPYHEPEVAGR